MPIQTFHGEVAEVGEVRGFPDFLIYDAIVFKKDDGSTFKLENGISVPAEAKDVFKPGLKGDFMTYSVTLGRRGVFALRPDGGTPRAVFKVPGEGMYLVMAIVSLVTIVLSPLAIFLFLQHTNTQKTKKEGEAAYASF